MSEEILSEEICIGCGKAMKCNEEGHYCPDGCTRY